MAKTRERSKIIDLRQAGKTEPAKIGQQIGVKKSTVGEINYSKMEDISDSLIVSLDLGLLHAESHESKNPRSTLGSSE